VIASPGTSVGGKLRRALLMSTLAVPEEFKTSATMSAVSCILYAPDSLITLLFLFFHITKISKAYPYKGSLLRLILCFDKTLVLTAFALIGPL